MQLLGTPGQHLITYVADAGTSDHDKLALLDMLATHETAAPDTVVPGHSRSEHPRK
jgi:hypothetical protein